MAPIAVEMVVEQRRGEKQSTGGRQKMNNMELAVVTRQFATLLDSGLTIEDALSGLIDQAESMINRCKSSSLYTDIQKFLKIWF